jgi:glycerol-3-phosphate O-acyltransferase
VVESCEKEKVDKVLLVPVSIAFDRIAEIDDYVAIQRGEPKRKESLGWFFNYIFGMTQPYGKIYVRFARPVALAEASSLSADLPGSEGTDPSLVTRMGFEVCSRIEQITPIKSADVLTMVLLGANGRALTAAEIHAQAGDIAALVRARKLPAASGFSLDDEVQVRAAVLALQGSGLVRCFDKANTPVYYIPRGKQLAAAYYRNTITHYFLSAALAEIGLAVCARDIESPNAQLLEREVLGLRDLYRFEFFFKPTAEFLQEVQVAALERYPGWNSGEQSLQKLLRERPPQFGHAILRSITESYLILAVTLLELEAQPVNDRKKFITRLLAQGEQMLLRRTISCESSVSQDLFANGLRLAEQLQLLAGGSALLPAREAFAQRVVSALSAINLLQRSYDAAWFSQLSAGKVSNLLGP